MAIQITRDQAAALDRLIELKKAGGNNPPVPFLDLHIHLDGKAAADAGVSPLTADPNLKNAIARTKSLKELIELRAKAVVK